MNQSNHKNSLNLPKFKKAYIWVCVIFCFKGMVCYFLFFFFLFRSTYFYLEARYVQGERLSKRRLSLKKGIKYQKYGSKNNLSNLVPTAYCLTFADTFHNMNHVSYVQFMDCHVIAYHYYIHNAQILSQRSMLDTFTSSPDSPDIGDQILI